MNIRNTRRHIQRHNKETATIAGDRKVLRNKLLFRATSIALCIYIFWRALYTLPTKYGILTFVFGLVLFASELMGFYEAFITYRNQSHYMEPELPVVPKKWYPHVDVFIATHNEEVELLYKTVNACTFMEYPEKDKVHIFICDDNNRPEMKAMAEELGVGYFGLEGNTEAKAGNLNNAMRQTHSPLVVTFDADMIPHSSFLMKTVPLFFLPKIKKTAEHTWTPLVETDVDPEYRIGFIQTPQAFYNPDLFQYYLYSENSVPNEQDYFFQEVNVGRNYDNAAIYAGSNTVISREALEAVGYISTGSITEDFLTGLRIQKAGYRCFATSQPLAHGLAPTRVKSLLSQRERWARGAVQAVRMENVLFTRKLTGWQRASYISGFFYWLDFVSRVFYLISPVASVLFNLRVVDASIWQVLIFWMPSYVLYNRAVRSLSGNKQSYHWNNVVETIIAPYLAGPVIAEIFGLKKRKFVVTDKKHKTGDKPLLRTFMFSLPYLVLFILGFIALIVTITQSINTRTLYNPIIMYWLIVSLKDLLFALFFVYGRKSYRMANRFYVTLPASIKYRRKVYAGETADISETGVSLILKRPSHFPKDTPLDVEITSGRYTAHIQCEVVNVVRANNGWKYGLKIVSADVKNKRIYMQIVYDRRHTLPDAISTKAGVFEDINRNLMLRTRRKEQNIRRLPRLDLDLPFTMPKGHKGRVLDFNFEYAGLQLDQDVKGDELLVIRFGDLEMVLSPADEIQSHRFTLFYLENRDALLENPNFDSTLDKWIALEGAGDAENAKSVVGEAMIVKRPPPTEENTAQAQEETR